VNERVELLLRVLCDRLPVQADAVYLFAQTEPNQESVFQAARGLLHRKIVRRIWISDCDAKSGYIGAATYRQAMIRSGIPEETIENVPMEPTEILHTQIESDAVVRFAEARGYEKLLITTAPFHQERAFTAMATAVIRIAPELKIYSVPGQAQSWDEVVTHSQGLLRGTRADFIEPERQRIEKYTAQGFLAPRADILAYLRRRDNNT
jgi:hypothetical protein